MITRTSGWAGRIRRVVIVAAAAGVVGIGGAAGTTDAGTASPPPSDPEPPTPRIVGGSDVDPPGSYPFMVALVTPGDFQFCGGALIAPTWVLTAAHCFTDGNGVPTTTPGDVDAIVGRDDLGTTDGQRVDVAQIVIHPNWLIPPNALDSDDDIALLELTDAVTVGGTIALATPADIGRYASGQEGTVLGWGSTLPTAPYNESQILQEVDVPFVSDADCAAVWGALLIAAEDVCAGPGPLGEDSCLGDSGGPLVVPAGAGPWTVIGIVSFGVATCGATGIPAVYTEVAAYADWILANIAADDVPTTMVEQSTGQADPTGVAPISFTVTFSEPVLGFDADDVALGGTAAPTVATVTPTGTDGTVFDIAVSGIAGSGTVTASVPAGAAVDMDGNESLASTSVDNVVIYDVTGPVLTTPGTLTVDTDPGRDGAIVNYAVTATDDGTPAGALGSDAPVLAAGQPVCTPPSGSFFPIGVTFVSCVATDTVGLATTGTFAVVVVDRESPAITDPGNQQAWIPAPPRGPLDYVLPIGSDNSGSVRVECTPPPGSVIGIGSLRVTCTAVDPSGNAATVSFDVVVAAPTLPATGGTTVTLTIAGASLLAGLALLRLGRTGPARQLR